MVYQCRFCVSFFLQKSCVNAEHVCKNIFLKDIRNLKTLCICNAYLNVLNGVYLHELGLFKHVEKMTIRSLFHLCSCHRLRPINIVHYSPIYTTVNICEIRKSRICPIMHCLRLTIRSNCWFYFFLPKLLQQNINSSNKLEHLNQRVQRWFRVQNVVYINDLRIMRDCQSH